MSRVRTLTLTALLAVLAAIAATPAQAIVTARQAGPVKQFRPGQVVVRTATGTSIEHARPGETVLAAAARISRRPGVWTATPNWIARISAFIPNDPGKEGDPPGNWQATQWNFGADVGVNAPQAWENVSTAGRPGAQGVVIAVLDTGVAYANRGRFRRSPDLAPERFRKGYDFVDDDPYPLDHNGHGTHVASTIAETANNALGLTGLAYNARIVPVRVLDRLGEGDSVAIARGIRFAAKKRVHIINLSFEFSSSVTADQIPDILSALRYARKRGVLVIGASGNMSARAVAYPARAHDVLSVAATTEHLCQAEYSNNGPGLDIAAPGGGPDASLGDDPTHCRPLEPPGRDIFQMTFTTSVRSFGLPSGYMGTSMAAPHVSATAALIIASGVIGNRPTPRALEERLKSTARDLGDPGPDNRYGWGLIDAARATSYE